MPRLSTTVNPAGSQTEGLAIGGGDFLHPQTEGRELCALHFEVVGFGTSGDKAVEAAVTARIIHQGWVAYESTSCQSPISDRSYPRLVNASVIGSVQIIDGAGVVGKLNGDGAIFWVKPRGMSGTTRACVGGDDSGARDREAPI